MSGEPLLLLRCEDPPRYAGLARSHLPCEMHDRRPCKHRQDPINTTFERLRARGVGRRR